VTTFAGSGATDGANGTGTAASFAFPSSVAVDSSGNVYVADTDNQLIRKITPAGVVSTLAGNGVTGSANGTGTAACFIWYPCGVAVANGTGTAASFRYPYGVAVDSLGNVYVADTFNQLIRKITFVKP